MSRCVHVRRHLVGKISPFLILSMPKQHSAIRVHLSISIASFHLIKNFFSVGQESHIIMIKKKTVLSFPLMLNPHDVTQTALHHHHIQGPQLSLCYRKQSHPEQPHKHQLPLNLVARNTEIQLECFLSLILKTTSTYKTVALENKQIPRTCFTTWNTLWMISFSPP